LQGDAKEHSRSDFKPGPPMSAGHICLIMKAKKMAHEFGGANY
jgi:hypothetical protein